MSRSAGEGRKVDPAVEREFDRLRWTLSSLAWSMMVERFAID